MVALSHVVYEDYSGFRLESVSPCESVFWRLGLAIPLIYFVLELTQLDSSTRLSPLAPWAVRLVVDLAHVGCGLHRRYLYD